MFFINGSLTSRWKVPALMAAVSTAGRESILVNDRPYCGDMLVSLVHAGGQHKAAANMLYENEGAMADRKLRARLARVKSVASPGTKRLRRRRLWLRNCRKPVRV